MSYVLTLVASDKPLTAKHVALGQTAPVWLAEGKAADFALDGLPTQRRMKMWQEELERDRVDAFVSKAQDRRKKLLLADMDATIVTTETLDELAAHAGLGERISAITARAMKGELDFKAALTERVGLLRGLKEQALQQTLDGTMLTPGATTLVRTMAAHGTICILVSGGFTFFTGAIAKKAGFHHHHGNALGIENGVLTGTVGSPILDKDAKLKFLQQYAAGLKINIGETLAIGDGANDLPMLQAAGLGIGYRPKPLVQDGILNSILYGDLTTALYAQGYRLEEFASA